MRFWKKKLREDETTSNNICRKASQKDQSDLNDKTSTTIVKK
jgi:hypothetical protein